MKILITGAKGQLGSSIQKLSSGYEKFEFLFTDIEELDITSPPDLEVFFEKNRPDICINCAGYTAVDEAEKNERLAFLLNRDAVRYLQEVTAKFNAKLFHISTDYVFNGHFWEPYRELDEPGANSVYGYSKLAGEQELLEKAHTLIVRTSWLYSEFGRNFFKTMMELTRTRDELKVIFDQVGTPTYADDLSKALLTIVSVIESGNFYPGIYHFSNEGVASWYDFACQIARFNGSGCKIVPIETHEYPLPAARPSYSVLNKSKIRQVYSVDIPHWQDSLKVCYENYLKL
jgi:dTDP-4-dehydrorhamnose reductase